MPEETPPSTLAADVEAAAKALDAVAESSGGSGGARLVRDADGGTSLVIKVTDDNREKISKAQEAIKALAASPALKEANAKDARERKERDARREKMLTDLMRAARDDKEGTAVQAEIKGCSASGEVLEGILNETEPECVEEKADGGEKESSNVNADAGANDSADVEKKDKAPTTITTKSAIFAQEGGWAAIHFACDVGNHEGLRYLLEAGADPNLTERMGATPLHRVILGAGKAPMAKLRSGGKSDQSSKNVIAKSDKSGNAKEKSSGISKMALPGVVKPKSSGSASENVDSLPPLDTSYLEDYTKCLKLLLESDKFDLMANERREEESRASGKEVPTLDTMSASDKALVGKSGLPKDDGYGISPLCLCVSQGYISRDSLYPLLERLLTRGFDPNASMCGVSALHIALRNAHYGCAFALTRAGANINALHPDGKTALQTSELIYGESFARELREASVVAMAVADPTRRRDMLRSQGEAGAKKLAKRAVNAGQSFIKASRWREAAGAYSEAAAYGPECLPPRERFACLRNMSECFLQVERGLKSEEVARQLLKEFPDVPLAMVAVGEAMSHPSCGKLTDKQLAEVDKLANEALDIEKKSKGNEWWRTLEPTNRGNSALLRALKLKGLVEGRTKEQNPAVKVANTALDEYFTPGGSIEKAAFAIELALKPEFKHPSPLPLHGIRGFIYYSWASEILRANSLCRSDRERKDGLLRVMAPLKNKMSFAEAHEKVEIAESEFTYYETNNKWGEFPKLMYGFNIAKTNFALGNFEAGRRFALASIKERAEADLARLDDDGTRKPTTQDDHFEGGSTQKLILQLNWSLDMNRMLITQAVIDFAINADAESKNKELPLSMLIEPQIDGLVLKDDVLNLPHLTIVLEKAVAFKLMDKASEKALLDQISDDPIKVNAAIRGLLSAMKTLELGCQTMNDLRVEVGKIIMKFVTGAHKTQKKTKSVNTRVLGSLLMEALEWDKSVVIPDDLPRVYVKMVQDFQATPGKP